MAWRRGRACLRGNGTGKTRHVYCVISVGVLSGWGESELGKGRSDLEWG